MKRNWNWFFLIAALALLIAVPAAIGGSASTNRSTALVACIELGGEADTRRDVKLREGRCARGEARANLRGPRGLRGTRGAAGARGAEGTDGTNGTNGAAGAAGATGATGAQGIQGPPGPVTPEDAFTRITELGGDFEATNPSVSMDDECVEFGPYADGGAAGGSVYYSGLNGFLLGDISHLVYTASYSTDNDTTVGVPYLRIFLEGDTHDVIFSPNTQPVPSVEEDVFHQWNVTEGTVRYDDDAGNNPDSTWAEIVAAHANEEISGIYVSLGFSAGENLTGCLRGLGVNEVAYLFGSVQPDPAP
jgi:hypothetical protein